MDDCVWCGDLSAGEWRGLELCERCRRAGEAEEERTRAYPYERWVARQIELEALRAAACAALESAQQALRDGDARRQSVRDKAIDRRAEQDRERGQTPRLGALPTSKIRLAQAEALQAAEEAALAAQLAIVEHARGWGCYADRLYRERFPPRERPTLILVDPLTGASSPVSI